MVLFEIVEKKGFGISVNEKINFFECLVKVCMMIVVLVLVIVVFKRLVVVKWG